jgi:hypothetical protein
LPNFVLHSFEQEGRDFESLRARTLTQRAKYLEIEFRRSPPACPDSAQIGGKVDIIDRIDANQLLILCKLRNWLDLLDNPAYRLTRYYFLQTAVRFLRAESALVELDRAFENFLLRRHVPHDYESVRIIVRQWRAI